MSPPHQQQLQQQQQQHVSSPQLSRNTRPTSPSTAIAPSSPSQLTRHATVSSPSPAKSTLFVGDIVDARSRSAKATPSSTSMSVVVDERSMSAKSAPTMHKASSPPTVGTLFVGDIDFLSFDRTKTTPSSSPSSSSSSAATVSSSLAVALPRTSFSSGSSSLESRHVQNQISLQQQLRRNDILMPEIILQV